jgi:hypothetical protein
MGREVRMVPADWQHPKEWSTFRQKMEFTPLMQGPFSKHVAEWDEAAAQWANGFTQDWRAYPEMTFRPKGEADTGTYEEFAGERPTAEQYMPEWPEGTATHLMMYEDTSEGTAISPAFATAEELARWLADNGASAFASDTATYEQWLATIRRGSAISMVFSPEHGIESGVAFEARGNG